MRCINNARIRAFLDKELSEKKRYQVKAHFRSCQECRARLMEAQEGISYIQSCLERLGPETVPRPPQLLLVSKSWNLPLKQWLLASVKIPAGVLVIFVVLTLAFSMMFYAKIKKEPNPSSGVLYFFSENRMKSISMDHAIKDLQPIENPRVFRFKEKGK